MYSPLRRGLSSVCTRSNISSHLPAAYRRSATELFMRAGSSLRTGMRASHLLKQRWPQRPPPILMSDVGDQWDDRKTDGLGWGGEAAPLRENTIPMLPASLCWVLTHFSVGHIGGHTEARPSTHWAVNLIKIRRRKKRPPVIQ